MAPAEMSEALRARSKVGDCPPNCRDVWHDYSEWSAFRWCEAIVSHPHFVSLRYVMPNSHLPSKVCITCGREFFWRKKWERDWERVKYCSKKCAAQKPRDGSLKPSR